MINAIHLHPNAIALWVKNSTYVKEWLKTAQNYLLEVDRFFEQCQKWYQDAPTVEEISKDLVLSWQ